MSHCNLEDKGAEPLIRILSDNSNIPITDVILHRDFLSAFRNAEPILLKYLLTDKIFESLIDVVLNKNSNHKIFKIIRELFDVKSAITSKFVSSTKLIKKIINSIGFLSKYQLGHISMIINNALLCNYKEIAKIFNNSPRYLAELLIHADRIQIVDILIQYIALSNDDNCYVVWSAFLMVMQCNVRAPSNWVKGQELYDKELSKKDISLDTKIGLLKVIDGYVERHKSNETQLKFFSDNISRLLKDEHLQQMVLKIVQKLPRNKDVIEFVRTMVVSEKNSLKTYLGIKVIQLFPLDALTIIEDLTIKFLNEEVNSFYFIEYVNIVKSIDDKDTLYMIFDILKDSIVNIKREDWRNNNLKICFYLDLILKLEDIIKEQVHDEITITRLEEQIKLWKDVYTLESSMKKDSQNMTNDSKGLHAKVDEITSEITKNDEKSSMKNKAEVSSSKSKEQESLEININGEKPKEKDYSAENLINLIHDKYWDYSGPTPEEIFSFEEIYKSVEDAYKSLHKP